MRAAVAGVCALLSPLLLAATLQAQEPERVIRDLSFEGNQAITDQVLAAAISTANSSWFARSFLVRWLGLGEKRFFDEEEFRRDVIRLHVLYRRSGFPNAKVDTTIRREPENVYVTFQIQEGEPMLVTSLTVALAIVATLVLLFEFFWELAVLSVLAAGTYIMIENLRELRS